MRGTPDRIRTCGLWLRKPTLYPAELRVHVLKEQGRVYHIPSLVTTVLKPNFVYELVEWVKLSVLKRQSRRKGVRNFLLFVWSKVNA